MLLLGDGAFSSQFRITTPSELVEFSNSVSAGTNYLGTTVLLDSDIHFTDDLSQGFSPIGNKTCYFLGSFDGQGYAISNLKISSSLQYVGLFGYSGGSIKNVILDSSCSVTSSRVSTSTEAVHFGGIVGSFHSGENKCEIENTVNMGDTSFSGKMNNGYLYFSGVTGSLSYSNYEVVLKNCVNYGSISHTGSSKYTFIGGIVGYSSGKSTPNRISIQTALIMDPYQTLTQGQVLSILAELLDTLGTQLLRTA